MEKLINNAPFALVLVFLVIGFVLLIKGADFLVEGSSSVAKRLHVPSIIIGLTIVAMGTSLPETAVSVPDVHPEYAHGLHRCGSQKYSCSASAAYHRRCNRRGSVPLPRKLSIWK